MRNYGHVPDDTTVFPESIDTLLGSSYPVIKALDFTKYIPDIKDQGWSSSCVGQALARAIHVRAGIQELQLDYPSVLGIYTMARQYGNKTSLLFDTGSQPRIAMMALSRFGICSEETYPFDYTKINEPLPWHVLEADYGAKLTGYYKVYGDNEERCMALRQALFLGYPIAFGMDVDQAYEDGDFDLYQSVTTPLRGKHMQCLVGYNETGFLVCNSWGSSWNSNGLAWLSDKWVGSGHCFDFYAVTVAPSKLW